MRNDRRIGRGLAVAVGAVGAVALLASVAVTALTHDPRQDIRLDQLANDQVPGLSDMQEDTRAVCGEAAGCVQGARSPEVDLLRFDTRENAAAFARTAQDGYHSEWIVIHYRDSSMSTDDREFLQYYLDSLGASD